MHEGEDLLELLVLGYLAEPVVRLEHELVEDLFVLHERAIRHQLCSLHEAKWRDFVDIIMDQGSLDREQVQLVRQEWVGFVMDCADGGQRTHSVHIIFVLDLR